MRFIKGLFAGLVLGVGVALALYAVGFVLELLNLITCGIFSCQCITCEDSLGCSSIRACDNEIWNFNDCGPLCGNLSGMLPMWSGKIFFNIMIFCGIAGTVIGSIYGVASGAQSRSTITGTIIKNVITKSDNIVFLMENSEKTIVSPRARKILEEAISEANKVEAALDRAAKIAEKAIGKSSTKALDNIKQAEDIARLLEKDIDAANVLHNQAIKEEDDWNRLQQEANNAVNKAKNAVDNAEKEVAKIEKMTFASVAAKDAVEKAAYALAKAKEAAAETVKRAEAAAKAASAQEAYREVIHAKNSGKRALVEEKIAIEEAKIAIEAE